MLALLQVELAKAMWLHVFCLHVFRSFCFCQVGGSRGFQTRTIFHSDQESEFQSRMGVICIFGARRPETEQDGAKSTESANTLHHKPQKK